MRAALRGEERAGAARPALPRLLVAQGARADPGATHADRDRGAPPVREHLRRGRLRALAAGARGRRPPPACERARRRRRPARAARPRPRPGAGGRGGLVRALRGRPDHDAAGAAGLHALLRGRAAVPGRARRGEIRVGHLGLRPGRPRGQRTVRDGLRGLRALGRERGAVLRPDRGRASTAVRTRARGADREAVGAACGSGRRAARAVPVRTGGAAGARGGAVRALLVARRERRGRRSRAPSDGAPGRTEIPPPRGPRWSACAIRPRRRGGSRRHRTSRRGP